MQKLKIKISKFTYIPFIILGLIAVLFFYKTFFQGLLPFPGDLLISEYKPWQTYSFLGYNPGSYPNKAQYFDTIRQLYPWRYLAIDLMKHGQIPLWNPYNFSGNPLLANVQSAVFYPFNFIFFIISFPFAWSILIMLQPLLASIFMFFYMRNLKISVSGALLSAIAYGYCLFMSVFLEYNTIGHILIWLPLCLLSIEKIAVKLEKRYILLFTFTIISAGFAGHIQIFLIYIVFSNIYIIWKLMGTNNMRLIKIMGIIMIIAGGITAIQYLPTAELISQSARTNQPFNFLVNVLLFQPRQILNLFIPDLYGNPATRNYLLNDPYPGKAIYIGIIPLLFSLIAMITLQYKKEVKFFSIISLGLFFCLVHTPITEIFYRLNFPLISTSSPSNSMFIISFSLAVLAGFGFDNWSNFKFKKHILPSISLMIITIFIFGIYKFFHFQISIKNLILSCIIIWTSGLIFISSQIIEKIKPYAAYFLILITIADLFYFFQKFNPFVPPKLIYPTNSISEWLTDNAGINRYWGYGSAEIEANFSSLGKNFSPEGYDPLYLKTYGQLVNSTSNGKTDQNFNNQNRSDAKISPGYGALDLTKNPYRLKTLALLGTKYILDRPENGSTEITFPPVIFTLIKSIDGWNIFQYQNSLPRIKLFTDTEFISDDKFATKFYNPNFNLNNTLIISENLNIPKSYPKNIGNAELISYQANQVKIKTNSNQKSVLFLSDNFTPGWQVKIDNITGKIIKADYSFRAVVLDPGTHIVIFNYLPNSFKIGATISLVSLILLVIILKTNLIIKYEIKK
jgi:hypothetical protein